MSGLLGLGAAYQAMHECDLLLLLGTDFPAALYPRYASFLRAGDTVVLETGSTRLGLPPMILADGVRVEAQVL